MSPASHKICFHPTMELKGHMLELIDHLRADAGYVAEPRARALFERSAETLTGLVRNLEDFESGDDAWPQAPRPEFTDAEL